MAYRRDGRITVVEYDGDEHYRHSIKIKTDRAKDEAARASRISGRAISILGPARQCHGPTLFRLGS
jgi:hypothetical protein